MYQPYPFSQQYVFPQPQMAAQAVPQMPRGISGRVVGNMDEIAPNEVPMDGSVAFFPSQDGSAVFAKAWNPNGTISTVRYVPDQPGQDEPAAPTIADVMNQLSDMQDMIRALSEPKQTRRGARKAAEDDAQS